MIVAEQFIAWNTGKMDPSRRYGVTGCRCESGKFHQAHNSETQKRSQGGPGESSKGYPSYRPLRDGHSLDAIQAMNSWLRSWSPEGRSVISRSLSIRNRSTRSLTLLLVTCPQHQIRPTV